MNFYEVFVKLVKRGREVGRTCFQLQASSLFMAAVKAEDAIDGRYGQVISCTIRVSPITEEEFFYCMVG